MKHPCAESAPPADSNTHHLPSLRAIARHALPNLVEATLVPTALFYLGWFTLGRWAAFAAALVWAYAMLARRMTRRQRVPGLLLLALLGLTVRTVAALATGSTFVYFVQP